MEQEYNQDHENNRGISSKSLPPAKKMSNNVADALARLVAHVVGNIVPAACQHVRPVATRASGAELKEGTSGEKTMSWKTINEILGSAILDEAFCQELLEHPLQAVQPRNFKLTAEEQEKLRDIKARDLVEFSQMVLAAFDKKE